MDKIDYPADYNNWKDTEAMIKFHLAAMDKQLMQVRGFQVH